MVSSYAEPKLFLLKMLCENLSNSKTLDAVIRRNE
jgi:hypothetical protein